MSSSKYFAASSINEIGKLLVAEVEKHYRFMLGSGLYTRMFDSHLNYHGISPRGNTNSHGVSRSGKSHQLSMMKINHYRNLGQHLLQLATSQKPVPQPIATNSDSKSQQQIVVAKGIMEYYSREKRVDRIIRSATEHSIVYSEGYVLTNWNAKAGSKIGEDTTNGDIEICNILPCDVIKDSSKDSFADLDWIIVRRWKNKYEVAAKYALDSVDALNGNKSGDDVVNAILGTETKSYFDRTRLSLASSSWRSTVENSDEIPVYEFYHKISSSLPNGRKVVFLPDGTVLGDYSLGVNGIPLRRICPGELVGSPYGYTPMFDLLVIQEAIDALYSAVATNQMTFGVQLIMAMKGSDIDFKQLARGLSFIEYTDPTGKPEALNLTHTPGEIFKFIQQLEAAMETLSGVNSTVRGNPESSLKSGSALALVQSQAIQFSSGLQMSYSQLVEDVYTDMLNLFKSYAVDARTITIVGRFNRSMVKSFKGSDIKGINRVVVESGSAISQTIGGRLTIAQDLLTNQLIKKPEEYLSVINTGKLDSMLEGEIAELINIKAENETMAEGVDVHALAIDPHSLHIREHRCVAASPEARNNPQVMQALSNHMLEHVNFLADPALANLLMVLGETPLIAAAPPSGDNMNPNQSVDNSPQTQNGGGEAGNALDKTKPNYPDNPQTGQQWDPQTGGVN